jgi:hypothetical protein
MTLLNSLMCASTWPSGRSDPNPEQVFGQAFETLTGLGFQRRNGIAAMSSMYFWASTLKLAQEIP